MREDMTTSVEALFRPFVSEDRIIISSQSKKMSPRRSSAVEGDGDEGVKFEEFTMPDTTCSSLSHGLHSHSQSYTSHAEEELRSHSQSKTIRSQSVSSNAEEDLAGSVTGGRMLRNLPGNDFTVASTTSAGPLLAVQLWRKEELYSLLSSALKCCLLEKAWNDLSTKWHMVLHYMKQDGHGTHRTDKTVRGKFLGLTREFKHVKTWKILGRRPSYECMSPQQRSKHGLPRSFDDELYNKVQEFYDTTGLHDGVQVVNARVTRARVFNSAIKDSSKDSQERDERIRKSIISKESPKSNVGIHGNVETSLKSLINDSTVDNDAAHEVDNDTMHEVDDDGEMKVIQNGADGGDDVYKIRREDSTNHRKPVVKDPHSLPNGFKPVDDMIQEGRDAKRMHVTPSNAAGDCPKCANNSMHDVMVHHINSTATHLAEYIQAVKMNIETANLLLSKQ